MDILKDDFNREFLKIKEKIEKASDLSDDDLKVILLSELNEEDLHESNS